MIISARYFMGIMDDFREDKTELKGFGAILPNPPDFNSINGFIDMAWTAYCRRIKVLPESPWKTTVGKVMKLIFALEHSMFKSAGNEDEVFAQYSERISRIPSAAEKIVLDDIVTIVPEEYTDNGLTVLESRIRECGVKWCFWCEDSEPAEIKAYIDHEVMEQLSGLKMEKYQSNRSMMISPYARESKGGTYHEEVVVAANMLLQEMVWCINSTSTRKQASYAFDIWEVEQQVGHISAILERTKHIC